MRGPLPRKILVVNTADGGGGAERFGWLLFKGLERRGIESWLLVGDKRTDDPHVVCLHTSSRFDYRPYGRWTARSRLAGLRWIERRLGLEGFRHPYSTHLLQMTGGDAPDLVACVNLHGGYFDLRTLPQLSRRVPVVLRPADAWLFTGHCACPLECGRWVHGCGRCPDLARPPAVERDATAWNWRRKRRIYRRSTLHAVTASRWQMARLERSMLMPALRTRRVIPNGVDQTVFRPGDRLMARQALGIAPDTPVALVVSNLGTENPYKDFATLRAAIERLDQEAPGPVPHLLVVGREAPPESWGAVTVRHLPYCPSPSRLALHYQAADVLLHATGEETFSFAIAEALSSGLPVVATGIAAVPENVVDGLTGLLVPPRDPGALARALGRVISDAALREHLGRNAAAQARDHLSVETMIDRYVACFSEICASEPEAGAAGAAG